MPINVCFIYPWATLGGVERVLLNRLIAFKNANIPVVVDLMFFQDSGGIGPLKRALHREGLYARIIVSQEFERDTTYDLVFCIDCPKAFALCEQHKLRYVAECHTPYTENRRYLQALPKSCELIVTPSQLFSKRIRSEVANLDIIELPNFVPWDMLSKSNEFHFPAWNRRPILFFARIDSLKNPIEFLDAFVQIELNQPGRFLPVLCGPQTNEFDIYKIIQKRNLLSKVVILPPIPFVSANLLLDMLHESGGIFVSPSKGESFGLSAAEALSAGVPAVLSDIEEHRSLVRGYENIFTYALGNKNDFAEKILNVFEHYETASNAAFVLRQQLSSERFLQDWNRLLNRLNLI
jgi:glycosyltransferase involved in cell wall biosynthesis